MNVGGAEWDSWLFGALLYYLVCRQRTGTEQATTSTTIWNGILCYAVLQIPICIVLIDRRCIRVAEKNSKPTNETKYEVVCI